MNLIKIIDKLRTKTVKKFAYGLLVLLILVDFIIPRHEIHFFGDKIPGFWSVFGWVKENIVRLGKAGHFNFFNIRIF